MSLTCACILPIYGYLICMSVVCTCMSSVCHSYVLVCHSYVLVCHPHITRMYSYVIRMSLVCTRMSFACHSYVVIRMSLICGFTMNLFRKQTFDAIKVSRKDKKKLPDGKTIHSYITQHNATNLNENSVLNAIKVLLKENLIKNTPTKEGDSYYIVSEDSSTTVISDNNDTKSNSQEETPSNEEIPKLGETSIQNIKEHESSENITISMLQTEFLTFKNFVMEEISSMNEKIS